jgi:hypothetical protein
VAEVTQRIAEAHGGGGFALALGGGGHGGDEDEMAVRLVAPGLEFVNGDFGDVVSVWEKDGGVESEFGGNVLYSLLLTAVLDFVAGEHLYLHNSIGIAGMRVESMA